MSKSNRAGQVSSGTDRRTDLDHTDLPSSAYRLGVDEAGREHFHDPMSQQVWVFRDGELTHKRDLDGRSVVQWVLFVDEDLEGWSERQPVEESGAFGGIVEDVVEAMGA